MDGFAPLRQTTDVAAPRRSRDDTVAVEQRDTQDGDAERQARARVAEPPPASFRARLNYDRERAEVYVEILDPQTGDVIRTLPPDQAAEDYAPLRESGSLLDALA